MTVNLDNIAELLLQNAPANIYVKSRDGRILYTNANQNAYLQVDSPVGKTDNELLHKTDAKLIRKNDKQVFTKECTQQFVEVVTFADNVRRTFFSIKTPIFNDERTQCIGLIGLSIDFTDSFIQRKEFDDILYRVPGNVFWKDVKGFYNGCNYNVAEILQIGHPQNIIGKTNYDLMDKRLADRVTENDKLTLEKGQELLFEEEGFDAAGKKAIYLTRKTPLYDRNHQIAGLIGASIDITAEKEKQELELAMQQAIVQQTSEKLKVMVNNVAHEVRTPLATMQLGIERLTQLIVTLQQERAVQDEQGDIVTSTITDEQLTLELSLLRKLKAHIRGSTGLIEMQLNNIAADAINAAYFSYCDIAEDITTAIKEYPYIRSGDPALIRVGELPSFCYKGMSNLTCHVIWNLLHNAFHFIQEVGKGEVFVQVDVKDDQCEVRIKDTAAGMAPEVAEQSFQPFFTQCEGRTGLGLVFCRNVMEAYGGTITCDTEEGKYTEFLLRFPLYTAS